MMQQPSILTQAVIEPLLKTARQNLVRDGFLIPLLLVDLAAVAPVIVPLDLPTTSEQKQRYFRQLGVQLGRGGHSLQAAVMLSESWFVNAQQAPAVSRFSPSRHPCRQEAIVIMGRNADNTRVTQVITPFVRAENKQLVWGTSPIAVYDEPVKAAGKPIGLLDYLFSGQPEVNGDVTDH